MVTANCILPNAPRILVICVARFGDTLLLTPTIAALKERWPQAILHVMAHPGRMEVLENLSFIDQLTGLTKKHAPWRGWLCGKKYDVALVYGDDAALFHYARRVSDSVIGFSNKNPDISSCLDHIVSRPQGLIQAANERAMLLSPLGIEVHNWRLHYQCSNAEIQHIDEFVRKQPWKNRKLVGLQLQSFPTKAYRDWPPSHFAELIRQLESRYDDLHFLLLGGPESRKLTTSLADELGDRVSSCAGLFTMRENAALMSKLALYIGVDTGPTHLAGAIGIPMVAMYHCAHPGRFLAPQQHMALTVIEHPLKTYAREASMADITVDIVLEAACSRLNQI